MVSRISTNMAEYFRNGISRGWTFLLIIVLCISFLLIPAFLFERSSLRDLDTAEGKLKEMMELHSDYISLRERIDVIERRKNLSNVQGVAQAVETLLSSIGIQGKIKSVKAVGTRKHKDALNEERSEFLIEEVTLNELVNMFFLFEDAPMMLTVNRVDIKKPFESPELLNITLTAALFTKK